MGVKTPAFVAFWRRRTLRFWFGFGMLLSVLPLVLAAVAGYVYVDREVAGFSRQVQHLMFSRNASAGVLYPRHFLGVELTAHVISSISRAV